MDPVYDETINPAVSSILVSYLKDAPFYVATSKALPWGAPADGDATRAVLPLIDLAAPLRRCPVPDPAVLGGPPFNPVVVCLHLHDFIIPAYDHLVSKGLLVDEDGTDVIFIDATEFRDKVDSVVDASSSWRGW